MENTEDTEGKEAKKQAAIRQANLILALDQAARENPHSFLGTHLEEVLEYELSE